MNKISFKSRVRVMALVSFIGSIVLVMSIIGFITKNMGMCIFSFIIYMCFKFAKKNCPKESIQIL